MLVQDILRQMIRICIGTLSLKVSYQILLVPTLCVVNRAKKARTQHRSFIVKMGPLS